MKCLRMLWHLVRADFLERVRRYSFLVVLATSVLAGYLFVPPEGAGYRVLQVGTQRGEYGSPWVGLMFGVIAALHLPLVGFFLVKNSVERDRETGVGQIIAATTTRKGVYVLGKWLSNLALLATILGVMTAMAAVMQLVRAEDTVIRPGSLLAPIWLMGLPTVAIAAALAVLFECIPLLRGGLGNIVYSFIWLATLALVLSRSIDPRTGLVEPLNDPFGYTRPLAQIQHQVLAADPDAEVYSGLFILDGNSTGTFVWDGAEWPAQAVLQRLLWAGLAVAVALAAAIPFDRFDPARSLRRVSARASDAAPDESIGMRPAERGEMPPRALWAAVALAPGAASSRYGRFGGVVRAELKLMLKGQSTVWYATGLGLNLACLFNPEAQVQRFLVAAVWVWPILIWSQMGVRERKHHTEQLVFSVPCPVVRQLSAAWAAGAFFTILLTSGGWLRAGLSGNVPGMLAWLTGTLFVPALAQCLGTWIGTSRAFEAAYLLWWYLGPVEWVPFFDYAGVTAEGLASARPLSYLGIAAGLVVLAMLGRWRHVPMDWRRPQDSSNHDPDFG